MIRLIFQICACICLIQIVFAKDLNCRIKVGCNASHCESVPDSSGQQGFSSVEFTKRDEFPMVCEDTTGSDAYFRLLDSLSDDRDKKFEKEAEQMHLRMARMERDIVRLRKVALEITAAFTEMNQVTERFCKDEYDGFGYGGVCFWVEIHSDFDTNLSKAASICNTKDSSLANIYSEKHYNKVTDYVRSKIPKNQSRSYVILWTGMKRDYKTNDALLSTGHVANYKKLIPSPSLWLTGSNSRSKVHLKVDRNPESDDQGFGAIWESWTYHGALCQSY
uniref:uncharacterized protein LOC120329073 n=1 Tax=Styela clava TaxID=7725 RepID=UPI0019392B8B|nr:uncharacterized protein LOC120329073 [Styela clava]